MIVVAIIGILASIAIPAYQDYMTRAKWSKALAEISALKLAVGECLNDNGGAFASCSNISTDLVKYGITQGADENTDHLAVTLGGDSVITITGKDPLAGCIFAFTPKITAGAGTITWTPFASAGNTNLADDAKCRTFIKGAE
jgi:type IV pilus assembly protein PilA